VTLRARIAPLRSQFLFPTLRLALVRAARRDPERFRIVHFSIQRDHIHLIVEARDKSSLSSGMRGLMIRTARYVNDLLGRRGAFWADRWHGRALASPRAVRNGIVYVLANFRKHEHGTQSPSGRRECTRSHHLAPAVMERKEHAPGGTSREPIFSGSTLAVPENQRSHQAVSGVEQAGLDPYSSAGWFDGWRDECASSAPALPNEAAPRDFVARTWLLRVGWRKHGLIGTGEAPAAVAERALV
jgi:REP element-mobilizing transposase RayT